MRNTTVTASAGSPIGSPGTFTDAILCGKDEQVALSIGGSPWSATVTLQRRLDGSNWRDVTTYTANQELTVTLECDTDLRLGVKTANYTSGTVALLLKGSDLYRYT